MSNGSAAVVSGRPHVLHLAHGTPDFALPEREEAKRWRRTLAGADPASYDAVVVVSAHASAPARNARLSGGVASPPLLHDYRGFDPALASLRLDVPEARPELRDPILAELGALGLAVRDAPEAALDHGVWVPLTGIFGPRLPVPVFSLGLPLHAPLGRVREWGQRLAALPLRLLWITSGGVVHNLSALAWNEPEGPPYGWARDFWEAVAGHLAEGHDEPLLEPWKLPGGSLAVPTPEHYAPFVFATGLTDRPLLPLATGFAYRGLSLEVLAGGGLESLLRPTVAHPDRPHAGRTAPADPPTHNPDPPLARSLP
jgi:4,5-DOPA dioxygenase extradiol